MLRDFPSLRLRWRLPGHKPFAHCLAFSHDSRLLASAGWDGTVRLWHLATGQELLSIPSLDGNVWSVAFSPDDRTLVFGSESGTEGSGAITLLHAATDAALTNRAAAKPPPPSSREVLAAIPPRPANCSPSSIDLTPYFNAVLTTNWINLRDSPSLSCLGQGMLTLGGTTFDIRGIVQLNSTIEWLPYAYPDRVERIRVARKCRALHFLQAAGWAMPSSWGAVAGEYVVHFAKGPPEKVPLVCGQNLADWYSPADEPSVLSETTTTAWRGRTEAIKDFNREFRLYDFRWKNPHPEIEIESLDFGSELTATALFLLAITSEE